MKNEIKCPNCGTVFTIDESMYDSIVKQIRDAEFNDELTKRENLLNQQKKDALKVSEAEYKNEIQKLKSDYENQINALNANLEAQKKDQELAVSEEGKKSAQEVAELKAKIASLESTLDSTVKQANQDKQQALTQAELVSKHELTAAMNVKDQQIAALKAELANKDQEKDLAVNKASNDQNNMIQQLNATIASLNAQLDALKSQSETDKKQALTQAKLVSEQELTNVVNSKDQEIASLKAQLATKDQEKALALSTQQQDNTNAINTLNTQVSTLKLQLETKQTEIDTVIKQAQVAKEQALELASVKAQQELTNAINAKEQEKQEMESKYNTLLSAKDVEIEFYKDLKARQSTKMIGESLEQHCSYEFNRLRPTAFRNAYFEKDNDARTGSKGDFIFRDYEDGMEYISIMFEMKNEADTTATKHKNEDFFKELDKDRKEKGCEYAVLVSLLESDNELYNQGIVDVSHKYEKMYVIRPQFFIPLITLLRNAAQNSIQYKKELNYVRNQNIDISHFEENLTDFQSRFGKNYESARVNFNKAIDEIDKSITHLQKIKDALTTSENQLRLANDKAQGLTIKKLTKNAPGVKAMFDAIDNE